MDQDVDQLLQFSPQEQIDFEKEQNIYSIVKTIEYLEWAYMSAKIKGTEYDLQFKNLLHHYKMCQDAIPGFNLEAFIRKY